MDVREALLFVRGVGFTIFKGHVGGNGVTLRVEEVECLVRDGGVAGLEESGTDGIAGLVTFGVNGLNVKGETRSEGIEDSAGRHYINMGSDSSESGAESDLLDEDVSGGRGKGGERDGGRRGVVAERNRFAAFGAAGSGGDDSRIKLNHGESGGRGELGSKGTQGKCRNSNRSHVTKDGQV